MGEDQDQPRPEKRPQSEKFHELPAIVRVLIVLAIVIAALLFMRFVFPLYSTF